MRFFNKTDFLIKRLEKIKKPKLCSRTCETAKTLVLYLTSFLLALLFIIFISYHLYFAKRVIPHVLLGNVKLTNQNIQSAKQLISEKLNSLSPQITYTYEGQKISIRYEDIGFYYDVNQTLKKAFEVGRSGSFSKNLIIKISAVRNPISISPEYRIDETKLKTKLEEMQTLVGNPPKDAEFFIEKDTLKISESKKGISIDGEKIISEIIDTFLNINRPYAEAPLPLISRSASINKEDMRIILEQTKNKVFNPPTLQYKEIYLKITPSQMLELLSFKKSPNSGKVEILLNNEALSNYVTTVANQINQTPKAEEFQLMEDRVIHFKPAVVGRMLDENKLLQDLTEYVLSKNNGGTITLNVSETSVPSELNEYGIKEILGEGHSNFSGSIQGRVHNILLSSARISGVLVPPGEIFSFNDSVGEISSNTGYHSAYIIKKGRTVLDDGGGVCQTSTTLFRAALNAGLKIVKRYAHAYRVSYYEIGYPAGFDATIYNPSVDFQFMNDTDNYILVQAEWNEKTADLWIRIYGTKDGRKVEISGPFVSNQSPPPEPLYVEDPSLPSGTTKQIDWAAWGASVTIKRKVTRNGEVLSDDTFNSNYTPWQAVYLVGTK